MHDGKKSQRHMIMAKQPCWMFLFCFVFMLESLGGNRCTENGFDRTGPCVTILKESPECYGWTISSKDFELPKNISKNLFTAFCENMRTGIFNVKRRDILKQHKVKHNGNQLDFFQSSTQIYMLCKIPSNPPLMPGRKKVAVSYILFWIFCFTRPSLERMAFL